MAKTKGVYKRGNVYWIRYAGSNEKTLYESSKSGKKKDAENLFIQRKKEVMDGHSEPLVKKIKKTGFRKLSIRYIEWGSCRQRGFITKEYHIKQLIDAFGDCLLINFSIMQLEEWQAKRMAYNKPATVNRMLATFKHMFTKAVEWEMIDENILYKVRKVKQIPENNAREHVLEKEESLLLISNCLPHLQPIVVCALNTGMRKEEILSLEWKKNVNLKQNMIFLDKTKNGKTREIPINKIFLRTLQSLLKIKNSRYVFTDNKGNRYKDIKKSFASACRKSGIENFRFHDLRHNFASYLVMAGVDLATLKELLGHEDIKITLRYAHLASAHKVKALNLLCDNDSEN